LTFPSLEKALWRVPAILAIGLLVMVTSSHLGKLTDTWFTVRYGFHAPALPFFFKLYMILLSLGIMVGLGKGDLAPFGFRRAAGIHWGAMAWRSSAVLAASFLLFLVIINVNSRITGKALVGFPDEALANTILSVWIWSSLAEEIFTRGLLQSFLDPLRHLRCTFGKLPISLPVVVSALLFSAMHLTLFRLLSPVFVAGILLNTFVMGLVASYYRERSGSLLPPVLIHVAANVIGCLPLMLGRLHP
jgi:membrane protease YdiL (CAAX protease family)